MTRAAVIVPVLSRQQSVTPADPAGRPRTPRGPEARLAEAIGLARAIDLDPCHTEIVTIAAPRPGTLLGSGKVEELAERLRDGDITLVIVDHPLTPVQQRNLERALSAKVLDRTGLILEIFGRRARTKEGTLQVELAHLNYQRGRLVRSWTHLERQRGGAGFLGGPGETQIEADRRLLQDRITRLKRELETVRRTRDLHRAKRKKVPFPVVAIVGYTNAGKSTLFNQMSGADVFARDMPFATLDPTIRRFDLPTLGEAALIDTVGFITDLPTHLIDSFQATLEEAMQADLLVHVRDRSSRADLEQAEDVMIVLEQLEAETGLPLPPMIEVWNKADLLPEDRAEALAFSARGPLDTPAVLVSALTGTGIDELLDLIEAVLLKGATEIELELGAQDGRARAWLHRNGEVLSETTLDSGNVVMTTRLPNDRLGQFYSEFPDLNPA
ncbi:MAG: GTPase HflX [Nitratireductor sp.]